MADYIVKDTELTGVANSIRTAGGTSSLLTFPNGFISAINNISGGGGGDFTTATVTVTNNSADDYLEFTLCYGITDMVRGNTIETSIELDNGESITVDAILYKGNYATIYPMQNLVCTGGITYTNGILNITGNGTITMN